MNVPGFSTAINEDVITAFNRDAFCLQNDCSAASGAPQPEVSNRKFSIKPKDPENLEKLKALVQKNPDKYQLREAKDAQGHSISFIATTAAYAQQLGLSEPVVLFTFREPSQAGAWLSAETAVKDPFAEDSSAKQGGANNSSNAGTFDHFEPMKNPLWVEWIDADSGKVISNIWGMYRHYDFKGKSGGDVCAPTNSFVSDVLACTQERIKPLAAAEIKNSRRLNLLSDLRQLYANLVPIYRLNLTTQQARKNLSSQVQEYRTLTAQLETAKLHARDRLQASGLPEDAIQNAAPSTEEIELDEKIKKLLQDRGFKAYVDVSSALDKTYQEIAGTGGIQELEQDLSFAFAEFPAVKGVLSALSRRQVLLDSEVALSLIDSDAGLGAKLASEIASLEGEVKSYQIQKKTLVDRAKRIEDHVKTNQK